MSRTTIKYYLTKESLKEITTDTTINSYKANVTKFANWCKQSEGLRLVSDIKDQSGLVQKYSDFLQEKGYSSSTIHSYLAPICKGFSINMADIDKPKRIIAENVRSRDYIEKVSSTRKQRDMNNPLYSKSIELQKVLGLRKSELMKLTSKSLVIDESGYPCVKVKGKGGKIQLQRIFPEDLDKVKAILAEGITKRDFSSYIDYHGMRADKAKQAYDYYLSRMKNDPSYVSQLGKELRDRYMSLHKSATPEGCKKFMNQVSTAEGNYSYVLRGKSADLARDLGRPEVYDRLAALAVSVFHLSHWRLGVTINNYLNT